MLCNSGSSNINFCDLGLMEEHSHKKENKTFTRHGLANSMPISTGNVNKKYPLSMIRITMTLINTHKFSKKKKKNS